MKVNLEASVENLLFLDYMEKQEKKHLETKADEKESWCCETPPQHDFKNDHKKIP